MKTTAIEMAAAEDVVLMMVAGVDVDGDGGGI